MSGESIPSAQVGAVRPPRELARVQQSVNVACAVGTVAWAATAYGPVPGAAVAMAWAARYLLPQRTRRRWRRAWERDIGEIYRLIGVGKRIQAERLLSRREGMPTNATGRAILAYLRGVLDWERGDLEGAAASFDACLTLMPAPDPVHGTMWWTSLLNLTNLQLELRRLHAADRSLALIRERSPGAAWAWQVAAIEAHHARAHERSDALGDDAQLHARAREASTHEDGGPTLANLAWLLEQRGDLDAAATLFAQVPSLLKPSRHYWLRHYPRMWAWLEPRLPPGA
jgi:hypothetical protein